MDFDAKPQSAALLSACWWHAHARLAPYVPFCSAVYDIAGAADSIRVGIATGDATFAAFPGSDIRPVLLAEAYASSAVEDAVHRVCVKLGVRRLVRSGAALKFVC